MIFSKFKQSKSVLQLEKDLIIWRIIVNRHSDKLKIKQAAVDQERASMYEAQRKYEEVAVWISKQQHGMQERLLEAEFEEENSEDHVVRDMK